jgi:hypothetical protein
VPELEKEPLKYHTNGVIRVVCQLLGKGGCISQLWLVHCSREHVINGGQQTEKPYLRRRTWTFSSTNDGFADEKSLRRKR